MDDDNMREAIAVALMQAEKRGIKTKDLRIVIARDAYEIMLEWQKSNPVDMGIPFDKFVEGYKNRDANITLCHVKLIQAEWGTGWTLVQKRKKDKKWKSTKSI